ncbi:MAG: hypothetical protein ACOCV4_01000 [Myxococcota bacterium]
MLAPRFTEADKRVASYGSLIAAVATDAPLRPHPLYEAAIEATEESISNAPCMAEALSGIDDHHAPALPRDELRRIAREYRVP